MYAVDGFLGLRYIALKKIGVDGTHCWTRGRNFLPASFVF